MAEKIKSMFYEVGYKINPSGYYKAERGIENLTSKARMGANQVDNLGGSFSRLAKGAAVFVGIGMAVRATSAYIKDSVSSFSDFEDSLRTVVSKVDMNSESLKILGKNAMEVGKAYNVLPKEVATASNYLALAGYSIEEIAEGNKHVVAAQKATGESMRTVSDIATDTASSYKIQADNLNYITDRMVETTSTFNTSFGQMGEALKYVAPIAKSANLEFADLSAYIGVLSNNAIKGTQAGTALRMAFGRLKAPVGEAGKQLRRYNINLYDQENNFIGINKSLKIMEDRMSKMTEKQKNLFMQQVFGTESMTAMQIVFKEGIDNIKKYGDSIDLATGKTQKMAKFMEEGVGGIRRGVTIEKQEISTELGEAFENATVYALGSYKKGLEGVRKDIEKDKQDISDLALGATKVGTMVVSGALKGLSFIGKAVDFATFGMLTMPLKNLAAIGAEERKSMDAEKALNNIGKVDTQGIPSDASQPVASEKKGVNVNLNVNIGGSIQDLGKDVGIAVKDKVDKLLKESFENEFNLADVNMGGNFRW